MNYLGESKLFDFSLQADVILSKYVLSYLAGKVDQVKVSFREVVESSLSVRNQQIEQLQKSHSKQLVVTVYLNNARGLAATTIISKKSIEQT